MVPWQYLLARSQATPSFQNRGFTYEISSLDPWPDTNRTTPRRFHRCPGRRRLGAFRPRVGHALCSGPVFVLGRECRLPLRPCLRTSVAVQLLRCKTRFAFSPDEVPDNETTAFSRVTRKCLPGAVTICIGSVRDTDVSCWLVQPWCG